MFSSEEESPRPRFVFIVTREGTKRTLGFFRSPLRARLERERESVLECEQIEWRRPAGKQHEIGCHGGIIERFRNAWRRVDHYHFEVLRHSAGVRAKPFGALPLPDSLDTPGQHAFALCRPGDETVLRVGIEHRDAVSHGGEFAGQIARDRRFTDAAFSSRYSNDPHGKVLR
jgi:hypothetical protein